MTGSEGGHAGSFPSRYFSRFQQKSKEDSVLWSSDGGKDPTKSNLLVSVLRTPDVPDGPLVSDVERVDVRVEDAKGIDELVNSSGRPSLKTMLFVSDLVEFRSRFMLPPVRPR